MSKRIMVVDDQPYLRDVQVMLLNEAGYRATAAASATEALGRLDDVRPDLILLDVSMPGMNGHEFLARLRAERTWAGLPVILTTGYADADVPPEPGTDVLGKPFSDTALMERVRRLIGDA